MAFPAKIRLSTALAAVLVLGACGGDGTATTPTVTATTSPTPTPTPAPTPAPSPTPTPTGPTTADLNAVVQQVLTIDLAALDNYAAPALPAYYDDTVAALDNTPAGDPVDDAVATVGRVLFYDVALSVDDSVSCATCHQQAIGFDDDTQLSEGVASGQFTGAHAMRLGNVRYYAARDMFWDRRADSVEDQATVPILNPVEMGWQDNGGMAALVAKLEGLDYYPALFTFAFGDEAVTTERIERALAHFQRAMISADSRWDRAYAQVFAPAQPGRGLDQPLPGFSASENRGRQLFMDPPNAGGAGCAPRGRAEPSVKRGRRQCALRCSGLEKVPRKPLKKPMKTRER